MYPVMGTSGIPTNSDPTYVLTVDLVGACVRMLRAMAVHKYARSLGKSFNSFQMRALETELNKHGFGLTCAYCYAFTRRANAIAKMEVMRDGLLSGSEPAEIQVEIDKIEAKLAQKPGKKDLVKQLRKWQAKQTLWARALKEAKDNPEWLKEFSELPDIVQIKTPAKIADLEKISPAAVAFANKYPEIHALKQKESDAGNLKMITATLAMAGQIVKLSQEIVDGLHLWGGLRWQSSVDFIPMMTYDYVQGIVEMAYRGVSGHTYTKEIGLPLLIGNSGLKINLSAAPLVRGGKVIWEDYKGERRPKLDHAIGSMTWEEIERAMEASPDHAGVMMLGVNDEILEWATTSGSKYATYVIPWHASGMPASISETFKNVIGAKDYWDAHESLKLFDSKAGVPSRFRHIAIEEITADGDKTGKWLIDMTQIGKLDPSWQGFADAYKQQQDVYRKASKVKSKEATLVSYNIPTGLIIDQKVGADDVEATRAYFAVIDALHLEPQFAESFLAGRNSTERPERFWVLKKHYARSDTPLLPPDPKKINYDYAKELDREWSASPMAKAITKGGSSVIEAYQNRQLTKKQKELVVKSIEIVESNADSPMRPVLEDLSAFANKAPAAMYSFSVPFSSKLEEAVAAKMSGKMFAPQLRAMLKNNQVSDDEITVLLGDLDPSKSITKQEVLNLIKANNVELRDVVLKEHKLPFELEMNRDGDMEEFASREDAIEFIYDNAESYSREDAEDYVDTYGKMRDDQVKFADGYTTEGAIPRSNQELFVTAPMSTRWNDGHTEYRDVRNPVVRIRFNIRTIPKTSDKNDGFGEKFLDPLVAEKSIDVNGNNDRILFVEEVQGPTGDQKFYVEGRSFDKKPDAVAYAKKQGLQESSVTKEIDGNQGKMPPYLQERIYDIGVKRVLAYAKEKGYTRVAWTPGEVQAKRWSLSASIDNIFWAYEEEDGIRVKAYSKDREEILNNLYPDADALVPVIGDGLAKDIAQRIETGEVIGEYEGLDLDKGGEGLAALYNEMLPSLFKKYGKEKIQYTEDGTPYVPITDKTPKVYPKFSIATSLPEETRYQQSKRRVQDKYNRLKVIEDALEDRGVQLSESALASRSLYTMNGKAADKLQRFMDSDIAGLIEETAKAKLKMSDVEAFLLAQHAPEANAAMRKLHGDQGATAFGMTDAEADAEMRVFQARSDSSELRRIANKWRELSDGTATMLEKNGIITDDMRQAWNSAYKHYIPLRGEEAKDSTGKGISVNGKQQRRGGHERRDEHVIENIIKRREYAIKTVEKNKTVLSVMKLILEANDPEIGTVGKPEKRKVFKDKKVFTVLYQGAPVAQLASEDEANKWISADRKAPGKAYSDYSVEYSADPSLEWAVSPQLSDNELSGYVNGHQVRIQINDEIAARALTNMGEEGLGTVLKAGKAFHNYLSRVYTGYDPRFTLRNTIRDFTGGMVNLTGDYGVVTAGKIAANYGKAAKELIKARKDPAKSKWVDRYRKAGGSTGASWLPSLERIGDDLVASYQEQLGAIETYRQVYAAEKSGGGSDMKAHAKATLKSGISAFKKTPVLGHFLRFINGMNAVSENAFRLATFITLVEEGKSASEAGEAAKNSTINFDKKGELTPQLSGLFLFFNPAVQGIERSIYALTQSKHKYQANALVFSMALVGYMAAAFARSWGDDDDEWDKVARSVKSRNLVLRTGEKKFVTLPMPYEYSAAIGLGYAVNDAVHGKFDKRAGLDLASVLIESLSPVGNPISDKGDFELANVMPTAVKMALAPRTGLNTFGQEIYPTKYRKSSPDSQLMFRSTKGTWYDLVANKLNEATGGNKSTPGYIDVSPETLKYYTRSLLGGAYTFIDQVVGLGKLATARIMPEPREVPMANVLIKETSVHDTRRMYYDIASEAAQAAERFSVMRKGKDAGTVQKMREEHGTLLQLDKLADKIGKQVKVKRDAVDAIRLDDSMSLKEKRSAIKEIEQAEEVLYNKLIEAYDAKR